MTSIEGEAAVQKGPGPDPGTIVRRLVSRQRAGARREGRGPATADEPDPGSDSGSASGSALFSFRHVGVHRDDRWIVQDVTATVPPDAVTALIGPSGAGKTTLLRLCNRLEVPDTGTVTFRGRDVFRLDVLAHRRRVGMVFQQPVLFGGTVRDNLLTAAPEASESQLSAAMVDVGLSGDVLDAQAGRLSTGEAQRACLARTLITRPAVLLLDEPTSALDLDHRLAFEQLVLALVSGARPTAHERVPTVWVTHDHDQLHRIADHVLALDGGRLVYAGPPGGLPPADQHEG